MNNPSDTQSSLTFFGIVIILWRFCRIMSYGVQVPDTEDRWPLCRRCVWRRPSNLDYLISLISDNSKKIEYFHFVCMFFPCSSTDWYRMANEFVWNKIFHCIQYYLIFHSCSNVCYCQTIVPCSFWDGIANWHIGNRVKKMCQNHNSFSSSSINQCAILNWNIW